MKMVAPTLAERWRTRACLNCSRVYGCPHSKARRRPVPIPEFVVKTMLDVCDSNKII